ncbi:hypothetical protein SSAG_03637 [Streptomyces sp. Mg1]|nr:hypothetical protein M444_03835 [Streptomyces sp. Mg1]EDX23748.1 hypothetical protein SSAG_03637 [Streptomyces sp. Mg1]OKI44379.1 hypothetical protein A6A28_02075 [Streptomyces sp. CB03578]
MTFRDVEPADAHLPFRVIQRSLGVVMRMRSALTASVLAAGILVGGAGAALADGVDAEYFSGGHKNFSSSCSSAAAVPALFGPVYTSNCSSEGEKEWAKFAHLGAS